MRQFFPTAVPEKIPELKTKPSFSELADQWGAGGIFLVAGFLILALSLTGYVELIGLLFSTPPAPKVEYLTETLSAPLIGLSSLAAGIAMRKAPGEKKVILSFRKSQKTSPLVLALLLAGAYLAAPYPAAFAVNEYLEYKGYTACEEIPVNRATFYRYFLDSAECEQNKT